MPSKSSKQKVIFSLTAPEAKTVLVAGNFTNWEQAPVALKKNKKDGLWKATVSLPPGTCEYRFLVDGQWWDDPNATQRSWNRFGSQNAVLVVGNGQ